jgi:hypothetical protein
VGHAQNWGGQRGLRAKAQHWLANYPTVEYVILVKLSKLLNNLTVCRSLLFFFFSFHFSLFAFCFSLFTFHFSLFTFHFSLFTFHFSLFTPARPLINLLLRQNSSRGMVLIPHKPLIFQTLEPRQLYLMFAVCCELVLLCHFHMATVQLSMLT